MCTACRRPIINNMKILKNVLLSAAFIVIAYFGATALVNLVGSSAPYALVFMTAIVFIARFTNGYWYGIISAVVVGLISNYVFLGQRYEFVASSMVYLVSTGCLVGLSSVISWLTSFMKKQSIVNERLYKEQAEIRLAAERERVRANLLRGVSHDLRTPLTSIYGASSALLDYQEQMSDDEIRQMAANIQQDSEWLIRVVENLLSVTRMTEDDPELKTTDEILEEIVSESIAKVRTRFPAASISMVPPEEILIVSMDRLLITQVIINLIDNAILHSGDMETIEVSMGRDGDTAYCQVRDHGKGIGAADIDSLIDDAVFDKGEFVDASRGVGIGLSVCRSIMHVHGGSISAENAPGGGALFRIELKLKEAVEYDN